MDTELDALQAMAEAAADDDLLISRYDVNATRWQSGIVDPPATHGALRGVEIRLEQILAELYAIGERLDDIESHLEPWHLATGEVQKPLES